MRTKQVARQEVWLFQRVQELLPGCTIKPEVDRFGSKAWTWMGVYLDRKYAGGFGFDSHAQLWIRTEPSSKQGSYKIACPLHLRQRVRAAVNQAIAELSEQKIAA